MKFSFLKVNPRASRTVPFISKCFGNSLVKVAAKTMFGKKSLKKTRILK
ncbi:MAG: hypothetical protein Ct9H90mP6_07670 [Gammaproteobacteria bacterium]|nr:MAG: hypothetical protein Ct9H90mP6_07670 [Gammaproteobacteria bacterium]